jgi:hypothetical protein
MKRCVVSERILRIPLSELKTVRFHCKANEVNPCSGTIEVPIEDAGRVPLKCPTCGAEFRRPHIDGALKNLVTAFRSLSDNDVVDLEFVFPDSTT